MRKYFTTQVLPDPEKTADKLAHDLVGFIGEKLLQQENIFIALSGGNSPQILFKILKDIKHGEPDWSRVHFFWVDERCVPESSRKSNFGNAYRLFFSKIDIPGKNLHPINGDTNPEAEAVRYAHEMKTHLPVRDEIPVFDIILLGMGEDGHTASIFPGVEIFAEKSQACAVSTHPLSGQKRITITEKVINNAKEVIFLVTGSSKAKPLQLIIENHKEAFLLPAKMIAPQNGNLAWYIDNAAAALLTDPKH
ncbi:MAG TPA: 6-phosphogluconolactonase [Bacteroidales bacterium]|nr:6-phosphogluconolactonase [Bacteroidales bacterium]